MRVARVGFIALTLSSACLRFGYEAPRKPVAQAPDASHSDAGVVQTPDAGVADAATRSDGGAAAALPASGAGGAAGSSTGAGRGGSIAAVGGAGAAAMDDAGETMGGDVGGAGGVAGASSGGAGGADAGGGAGAYADPALGETGLHLSDVLGYYSGDWGDMVLREHGSEIWAVYEYSDGTIVGTIGADGVFSGWWTKLPTRSGFNAGEVEFRWSQSGGVIALDGRWRYGTSGDWLENWDDSLVTGSAPPSALSDRFAAESDFVRHP